MRYLKTVVESEDGIVMEITPAVLLTPMRSTSCLQSLGESPSLAFSSTFSTISPLYTPLTSTQVHGPASPELFLQDPIKMVVSPIKWKRLDSLPIPVALHMKLVSCPSSPAIGEVTESAKLVTSNIPIPITSLDEGDKPSVPQTEKKTVMTIITVDVGEVDKLSVPKK